MKRKIERINFLSLENLKAIKGGTNPEPKKTEIKVVTPNAMIVID